MKVETIQVELPKEIIESAEKVGMSKVRISEILRTFAILEITANLSKLRKEGALAISKKMKAQAWQKTKKKLEI